MRNILLSTLALLALALTPLAQDRLKFDKQRDDVLRELGDRHLDLGLWCRDRGLTTQAAAEFVLAVEISEGKHYGATAVLSAMRRYDDAFWKKRKRGTAANRKSYEIKAAKARQRDAKDLLDFADWAWKKSYEADALEVYLALVREAGNELVFDAKGRLVLEHGTIREEAAAVIRDEAREIDGKLYLADEFLGALPQLEGVGEVSGEALRVRGTVDAARLERYRAVGAALMERLENDLEVRPARRLDVFVFPARADFTAWLEAAGMADYAATSGVADGRTSTAIVCAEGKSDEEVEGLLLHELTHLFWFASTPTGMPDWFSEGIAETYGGQGTYGWDGETLVLGGAMAEHRLAALRMESLPFSLERMLDTRAVDLWATDANQAFRFYAQSWAFLRFLRTAATEEQRERFDTWVAMCAGSAAGGDSMRARDRNAAPAAELFRREFGHELDALETAFAAWVREL